MTNASDKASATDAWLVASVIAGDLGAFEALVHRYRDAYTRYAVRMLGSPADAEDVLQGVWMRAFRNMSACREPEKFGAWLYQIVVNECRTFVTRRARRDQRFSGDDTALDRIAAAPAPDGSLREEIQRALDTLPVEQREAFVLKHVEQLEYDEMAELTGAGVSALKMRVKRATDRLRELLEGAQYG
jgi:RNA polymerase sigma-70 factor (ECF subfamily)